MPVGRRVAALDPGQFCRARGSLRLPHAHFRRSTSVPLMVWPHLYAGGGASVKEMRALHRALHTERVVIVNPSIYGTDNSCTLDAVKQLGPGARAIAVIDEKTSDARLDEMAHGGVRGIRLNFETFGEANPDATRKAFHSAVERVAETKVAHSDLHAPGGDCRLAPGN